MGGSGALTGDACGPARPARRFRSISVTAQFFYDSKTSIPGDQEMGSRRNILRDLLFATYRHRALRVRRARALTPLCDSLEGRVVPAHYSAAHHALAAAVAHHHDHHAKTATTTADSSAAARSVVSTSTSTAASSETSGTTTSSTSSSTLSSALQTLRNDVQTIELASNTTIGELTAIRVAMQTLSSDGLSPSSESALQSFENSLVTTNASGTSLTGNTTLLSEFEALYTTSPTTQESTDLTDAYNALAAAVTSAGVTSADITTIDTDWAAVLAAEGSTSTATFPYFTLVTGQQGPGPGGGGGCQGM